MAQFVYFFTYKHKKNIKIQKCQSTRIKNELQIYISSVHSIFQSESPRPSKLDWESNKYLRIAHSDYQKKVIKEDLTFPRKRKPDIFSSGIFSPRHNFFRPLPNLPSSSYMTHKASIPAFNFALFSENITPAGKKFRNHRSRQSRQISTLVA